MGFFEPPPRPEAPEQEPRLPHWYGAPEGAIGAPVDATLLIARTDQVAVGLTDLLAYPTGFSLRIVVFARRSSGAELALDDLDPSFGFAGHRRQPVEEDALPDNLFRFGVQFSDGAKATSVGADAPPSGPGRPAAPVLLRGGSGGGGHSFSQDYWVWPLPPAGPLAFVCEWPAYGIALTRVEIEAERVRAAAAEALAVWPEEEPFAEIEEPWPPERSAAGWTSYWPG